MTVPGLLPPDEVLVDVELRCPDCRRKIRRRIYERLTDAERYSLTVTHVDGPLGHEHVMRPRPRRLR